MNRQFFEFQDYELDSELYNIRLYYYPGLNTFLYKMLDEEEEDRVDILSIKNQNGNIVTLGTLIDSVVYDDLLEASRELYVELHEADEEYLSETDEEDDDEN